ncbi:translation elongation factor Ts [Rhodovulum sp. MB263]|uniref:translation elongation factor Ts n=1 Tax=unclassified Rhodovulum TaxID=2631432 RepID=UPI0009B72AD3|nr:translation elongation factor Ts [Rhodovulum sp. MB263]ARC88794.1 translation elongation factor Ts [Rhodovulum sp. MB263]
MAITAALVKELRDKTGAGMMDAKKALTENDGNMDAAIDWLRTKGLAKAAKKSGRTAAEGLVAVVVEGGKGVAVEVNSETDFVAKNAEFQAMVSDIAKAALGVDDLEALKAADLGGKSVADTLTDKIATVGENMTLRRMARIEGEQVVAYVHNAATEGMGKIGVLVAMSGGDEAFGRQVAMHVAAVNPAALSEADMDPAVLEKELAVQTAKALDENATAAKPKPEAVITNNIIPGRMKKFISESTLMGQAFVVNPDLTVEAAAQAAGATITGFVRLEVGEGIEKAEEDFAAEVAKVVQG